MVTRRTALITIAAGASAALGGAQSHQHESEATPVAHASLEPRYFNPEEFAVVSRVSDLIIPRTDTPGAADAGVPIYIDRQVYGSSAVQEQFTSGILFLNSQAQFAGSASFVDLAEPGQIAVLTPLSFVGDTDPNAAFFQVMKKLTTEGYYASEEGLVQELGFKGNTFRMTFPGCTHPEHQI